VATSVNQVIKETIQTIKERGLVLTPDNYAEVFCETAKKNGVIVPDCQKLEKYVGRLNDEFKAQLKQKNVKSVDELKGKKLIVNKGTTADAYFTKNHPDIELIKYDQNTTF